MNIKEWDEKVSFIDKKYNALYHSVAKRWGFSDIQHWILYRLCVCGRDDLTQNDLAQSCGLPKQSINSASARLKDMGYIDLVPCPGGNKKQFRLTEEGRKICDKCVRPLIEAEARVFESTPSEELELFLRFLEKRYERLNAEISAITE